MSEAGVAARLTFLLAAGVTVGLCASPTAWALKYDPSTCKADAHGKFYVALGWNVLGLPLPHGLITLDQTNLVRRAPPDPAEPEGCPNNPVQTKLYGFQYKPAGATEPAENQGPPVGVSSFTLYDLRFGDLNKAPLAATWDAERVNRDAAETICAKSQKRDEQPDGLFVCRFKENDQQAAVEDWTTAAKADQNAYKTPLGGTFVFICGGRLFTSSASHCDVAYSLTNTLGVDYTFAPYRGRTVLPVGQVIALDKAARAEIQAATVENYPWPASVKPNSP